MTRKVLSKRIIAVILCVFMVLSILSGIPIYSYGWNTPAEPSREGSAQDMLYAGAYNEQLTQEEIKSRLMYKIEYEGWDPYSSDMSLDEFYALMELFQEGSLPIESESEFKADTAPDMVTIGSSMPMPTIGASGMGTLGIDEPEIEDPETDTPEQPEETYIPSSLFLTSGLDGYNGADKPDDYNNDSGNGEDYPPGLDPNGAGYYIPPSDWQGVKATKTNNTEAFVIVPGVNADNGRIAGDVDQSLFPAYDGHYVRRVIAQNYEVTVLGAIKLLDDKIVYYYLTNDSQSTEVSTTMLSDGQKFVIQYNVSEYNMTYEVRIKDKKTGETTDVTEKYVDYIFGADRPTATTDSYYSFVATVPYGYTMQIFRKVEGSDAGEEEITGKKPATGIFHNDTYPLGTEPVYIYPKDGGFRIEVDTSAGPSTLKMSDAFYNDHVDADRTIIAVLTKKDAPVFDARNIIADSSGTKGSSGMRGSSAVRTVEATNRATESKETIPYDYEDEYLWRRDGENGSSKYIKYSNGYPIGNIQTGDGWGWKTDDNETINKSTMDYNEDDGTYSYQWTFQTNNSDEYLMDVLEINGIPLTLPFFPKYSVVGDTLGTDDGGIKSWFTETDLPHDIHVRVEMLMTFKGDGGKQRVYRITVTNARSNVTVTGLNLMQYAGGAKEISTYALNGIYADYEDGTADPSQAAVQFFDTEKRNGNTLVRAAGWHREAVSNVHVDAIDYPNGDPEHRGANIRFRLADGYDSPYYLFESSQDGTIKGTDDNPQASISRDADGKINFDTQTEIKQMSEVGENDLLKSQYIYYDDEDGWYYIRVTTQREDYKMALLTIGAREVKYVVRYLGSYPDSSNGEPENALTWDKIGEPDNLSALSNNSYAGIVKAPKNVPEFTHIDDKCHPSFHKDTENDIPGQHYDDKNGDYYDTAHDTVALVPLDINSTPTDPDGKYAFVDWVLVDEDYKVIKVNGSEFHYLGNPITIAEINEYAIKNDGLGGSTVDVYVLRLMPTWRKIENPFRYKVALNWVDAQGNLNENFFDGYWNDVVTDWESDNGGLTVKVLKDAEPFLDWIAQHPTYNFWDEVNNNNALYRYAVAHDNVVDDEGRKAMRAEMAAAIEKYLPFLVAEDNPEITKHYNAVLDALCNRDISGKDEQGNVVTDHSGNGEDDFWRLGNYAFQVLEDEGTIVIWMYENKGGLMFREEVQEEPFRNDEEFYFTVSNVQVGVGDDNDDTKDITKIEDNVLLSATYKAYPQQVYDEFGNPRDIKDKDAWLVTFENGEIVSIVKNDGSAPPDEPVTYFTLKSGDGIMLYVPEGRYTIAETGSKSGGAYKTEVDYNGDKDPTSQDWDLPNSDGTNLWLSGSKKSYDGNVANGISQIAATVNFDVGENNVVSVLTFRNQTCSLAIGDEVLDSKYKGNDTFEYNIKLNLPDSIAPEGSDNYYFNYNIYDVDDKDHWKPVSTGMIAFSKNVMTTEDGQSFNWESSVTISANQIMTIVMIVPDDNEDVHYYIDQKSITILNGDKYKLADGQEAIRTNTMSAGEMAKEVYIYGPGTPMVGELTVKCIVDEAASDDVKNAENIEFTYTVTILTDVKINGTYGDMEFVDNVATFKLKANGSKKAKDLPDALKYTVVQTPSMYYELTKLRTEAKYKDTETVVTNKRFTSDKPNASVSGSIAGDIEDIITFTNKLVKPAFTLPATGGSGTVIFYILGGAMISIAPGYLAFTSGKRRIKKTH